MKGLRESTKNVIKNLKEETEYQKFFAKALKKYGKSSPAAMTDEEKKEFFDYVDRNWKGAHEESVEEAAENWKGRALRVGKSHVIELFPDGGKLYNKSGVATLLTKEELYALAKGIKEKNIPITEGLHMFSGNIKITKKRVLPLLKKMGISKVKVKSVGGMFLDVYFDADDEKFKQIEKEIVKNFGKQGSSSWKNLNMSLESDSLKEFGKMHVLKLSKQQLKGMILRAKRAGARRYDIIKSMSRDLSASPDEVVSALEKNGLIRMTEASGTLGKMLQRMKQKMKEARAHYTNWHINVDEFLWDVDIREGDGKKLVKAIYNNRFTGSNSGKAILRTMEDIMKDAEKALKSK
jgi:hypothetical protein|tara:strand:- start:253 stop:1302 length:1050 start_codon:yes stop_codon:yes gene_type:complete